jgi:hypothetical protein
METEVLIRALNNMFWDRVSEVTRRTIEIYSHTNDLNLLEVQLKEWEHAGYIQVIKPLAVCCEKEACVRLLRAIPFVY